MTKLVTVQPIYGWGWTDGDRTLETPAAFISHLVRDGARLTGTVEGDHPLAGHKILLTPRHTVWDGHVNVELTEAGIRINGYAEVPVETLS